MISCTETTEHLRLASSPTIKPLNVKMLCGEGELPTLQGVFSNGKLSTSGKFQTLTPAGNEYIKMFLCSTEKDVFLDLSITLLHGSKEAILNEEIDYTALKDATVDTISKMPDNYISVAVIQDFKKRLDLSVYGNVAKVAVESAIKKCYGLNAVTVLVEQ